MVADGRPRARERLSPGCSRGAVLVTGSVTLVGAGPGDPDLITVKGAAALARADVVVYDRLVAPELLDLCPPGVERVYAGKEPGRAQMSQDEINAVLVDRASRGLTVSG